MEAWDKEALKRRSRLINDSGRRAWGKVKGHIDALELSLHRLGWTAEGAFVWVDDLGTRREVLDYYPCMWKIFLRDAVQRWHEMDVAEKIGSVNGACCNRVCYDVPRHVMNLSAVDETG